MKLQPTDFQKITLDNLKKIFDNCHVTLYNRND